ncbi:MAG: glycosyltransferase family 4 protein [Nitrospirae bacterium]|nr:glycosyltransferase family 4 protein [Nitrospirota bacterium]
MTIFYPVPELMLLPRARFIQIINTAHALARAGAAVKLITGRSSCLEGLVPQEALLNHYGLSPHPNLEIVFLPMVRGRVSIGMVFNSALMWYLWRQDKKDGVIFVRHLKTARFLLRMRGLYQMPVVFEAHEIFHLTTENTRKRQRMARWERSVYAGIGAVVTITERLRADLVTMFSLCNIHSITIPDAVRGDMFEATLAYGKRRHGYIFYAGGFYRWKGIDLLIEAMGRLPGETLVVAGGGQGLKRLCELRGLADSMGLGQRVNFVGQLSHTEVLKYMMEAKIAVVPNLAESVSMYSSPLKMFEYMASGCPIVASDIPGIREILTDGKDAVFFTPGDVQSLSSALRTLIDNPDVAEKMAAAGQALVKNFTYEKRAERIIDFLGVTFYN